MPKYRWERRLWRWSISSQPYWIPSTILASPPHLTISQLKEDLETVKMSNNDLTKKLEKLDDNQNVLMRINNEMKIDATNRE